MLELIILWKLTVALGRIAVEKNRSRLWAGLGIAGWASGYAVGFAMWRRYDFVHMWFAALACAAGGGFLAYWIVRGLARLPGPDDPIPHARIVDR